MSRTAGIAAVLVWIVLVPFLATGQTIPTTVAANAIAPRRELTTVAAIVIAHPPPSTAIRLDASSPNWASDIPAAAPSTSTGLRAQFTTQ